MMVRKKDAMGRIGPVESEVCFPPPEGLELDGNAGTATVKWKKKPDGDIEITSFEGVSLGGSPGDEGAEGETSDADGMASGIDNIGRGQEQA